MLDKTAWFALKFIPEVEANALCRSLKLFHTDIANYDLTLVGAGPIRSSEGKSLMQQHTNDILDNGATVWGRTIYGRDGQVSGVMKNCLGGGVHWSSRLNEV